MLKHAFMQQWANKEIIPSKHYKVRINVYVYSFEKLKEIFRIKILYERQKWNTTYTLYITKL